MEAVTAASRYLMANFATADRISRWSKPHGETETRADIACAELIAQNLQHATPTHGLLFEEEAFRRNLNAEHVWVTVLGPLG